MARYVSTKRLLAQGIGVTYRTLLSNWNRPDRPIDHSPGSARYDVAAYRKWFHSFRSAHNAGKINGSNGHGTDWPQSPRDRAIIQKSNLQAEQLQLKIAKERRDLLPTDEVNSHIDSANAIFVRELRKGLGQELPPRLEGLNASEMQNVILAKLDHIFLYLPKALKK